MPAGLPVGPAGHAPALPLWKFASFDAWQAGREELFHLHRHLRRVEQRIASEPPGAERFGGYSIAAGRNVRFSIRRDDTGQPHWRESFHCPATELNARTRAAYHAWRTEQPDGTGDRLYVTEAGTVFHRFLRERHPGVRSSLFRPGAGSGSIGPDGFRCEDLTHLSFEDEAFDAILCLEVLEHVADYRAALRQCARVLAPGGVAVLTLPFRPDASDTLVRASTGADGAMVHHVESEFHEDPLDPEGVLCLYHFGWSVLDDLRAAGFARANVAFYASRAFGYLGAMQSMILAER